MRTAIILLGIGTLLYMTVVSTNACRGFRPNTISDNSYEKKLFHFLWVLHKCDRGMIWNQTLCQCVPTNIPEPDYPDCPIWPPIISISDHRSRPTVFPITITTPSDRGREKTRPPIGGDTGHSSGKVHGRTENPLWRQNRTSYGQGRGATKRPIGEKEGSSSGRGETGTPFWRPSVSPSSSKHGVTATSIRQSWGSSSSQGQGQIGIGTSVGGTSGSLSSQGQGVTVTPIWVPNGSSYTRSSVRTEAPKEGHGVIDVERGVSNTPDHTGTDIPVREREGPSSWEGHGITKSTSTGLGGQKDKDYGHGVTVTPTEGIGTKPIVKPSRPSSGQVESHTRTPVEENNVSSSRHEHFVTRSPTSESISSSSAEFTRKGSVSEKPVWRQNGSSSGKQQNVTILPTGSDQGSSMSQGKESTRIPVIQPSKSSSDQKKDETNTGQNRSSSGEKPNESGISVTTPDRSLSGTGNEITKTQIEGQGGLSTDSDKGTTSKPFWGPGGPSGQGQSGIQKPVDGQAGSSSQEQDKSKTTVGERGRPTLGQGHGGNGTHIWWTIGFPSGQRKGGTGTPVVGQGGSTSGQGQGENGTHIWWTIGFPSGGRQGETGTPAGTQGGSPSGQGRGENGTHIWWTIGFPSGQRQGGTGQPVGGPGGSTSGQRQGGNGTHIWWIGGSSTGQKQGGTGQPVVGPGGSTSGQRQGRNGTHIWWIGGSSTGQRQGGTGQPVGGPGGSTSGQRQGGNGTHIWWVDGSSTGQRQGGPGQPVGGPGGSTSGQRQGGNGTHIWWIGGSSTGQRQGGTGQPVDGPGGSTSGQEQSRNGSHIWWIGGSSTEPTPVGGKGGSTSSYGKDGNGSHIWWVGGSSTGQWRNETGTPVGGQSGSTSDKGQGGNGTHIWWIDGASTGQMQGGTGKPAGGQGGFLGENQTATGKPIFIPDRSSSGPSQRGTKPQNPGQDGSSTAQGIDESRTSHGVQGETSDQNKDGTRISVSRPGVSSSGKEQGGTERPNLGQGETSTEAGQSVTGHSRWRPTISSSGKEPSRNQTTVGHQGGTSINKERDKLGLPGLMVNGSSGQEHVGIGTPVGGQGGSSGQRQGWTETPVLRPGISSSSQVGVTGRPSGGQSWSSSHGQGGTGVLGGEHDGPSIQGGSSTPIGGTVFPPGQGHGGPIWKTDGSSVGLNTDRNKNLIDGQSGSSSGKWHQATDSIRAQPGVTRSTQGDNWAGSAIGEASTQGYSGKYPFLIPIYRGMGCSQYRPNVQSQLKFDHKDAGGKWQPQQCAPGTRWSQRLCTCVFIQTKDKISRGVIKSVYCEVLLFLPFDGNILDKSPSNSYIGLSNGVLVTEQGAFLDGTTSLNIPFFNGNFMGNVFLIQFSFKTVSREIIELPNKTMTLISNGCENNPPSLHLSYMTGNNFLVLRTSTVFESGQSLACPTLVDADGWSHVSLEFCPSSYAIFVNGQLCSRSPLKGSIDIRNCDLVLGENIYSSNSSVSTTPFMGFLDNVNITRGCACIDQPMMPEGIDPLPV